MRTLVQGNNEISIIGKTDDTSIKIQSWSLELIFLSIFVCEIAIRLYREVLSLFKNSEDTITYKLKVPKDIQLNEIKEIKQKHKPVPILCRRPLKCNPKYMNQCSAAVGCQ